MTSTYLFLDYDGVFHDDSVYLVRKQPVLRAPGELFMYAPLLVEALNDYPKIKIVLSTSWVAALGFERAKSYLPQALQDKVIGATRHSKNGLTKNGWFQLTRFYQISTYVDRHHLGNNWLAIDDDAEGWPATHRHHLIYCEDSTLGLSAPGVMQDLIEKLAAKK